MKKKLKGKQLTVRMSKSFANLVYSTADKLDLSVSELVRAAVESYLCQLQTGEVRPEFLSELVKTKNGRGKVLESIIAEAIRQYAASQGELQKLESRQPTKAEEIIRSSGGEG